jgi:phosphatidylinositol-3,4,5-trisphosphate 3-phosphatase and dual-specificity protein phosphatase PTEN
MMLKKIVSGKRNRFEEGGHDIDLSYICQDRVIVMSYPADGVRSFWRNNIKDVKRFLDERHKDHYWVYNVSERPYDSAKFDEVVDRVSNHNWQDHHAPPFHMLLKIVDEMYKKLKGK